MRAFLLPFLAALSMVQIGLGASANSKVYALKDGYVDANGVLIYYTELGQGLPLVILHGGPGASHDYLLPWLLPLARTKAMNEVLAREKAKMPPEKLARLEELEKAGLFGKGEIWEHGRYPTDYQKLAWGVGYFPFQFGAHPDANYDPTHGQAPTNWELYREMWGSHGEFVIDGNLTSVEYVDRLPTIKVPTLVIAGDHDECDPSLARTMHEKIANSKLVILPSSGHQAFRDQPKLWIESVRDFVNGADTKGISK
jgi:pimeloyl-ACP methyl ester carboxylesterase